jgi:hypothetical protein
MTGGCAAAARSRASRSVPGPRRPDREHEGRNPPLSTRRRNPLLLFMLCLISSGYEETISLLTPGSPGSPGLTKYLLANEHLTSTSPKSEVSARDLIMKQDPPPPVGREIRERPHKSLPLHLLGSPGRSGRTRDLPARTRSRASASRLRAGRGVLARRQRHFRGSQPYAVWTRDLNPRPRVASASGGWCRARPPALPGVVQRRTTPKEPGHDWHEQAMCPDDQDAGC